MALHLLAAQQHSQSVTQTQTLPGSACLMFLDVVVYSISENGGSYDETESRPHKLLARGVGVFSCQWLLPVSRKDAEPTGRQLLWTALGLILTARRFVLAFRGQRLPHNRMMSCENHPKHLCIQNACVFGRPVAEKASIIYTHPWATSLIFNCNQQRHRQQCEPLSSSWLAVHSSHHHVR